MKLYEIKSKILFVFLIGLLFTSCRKDLGNYEYVDINSLQIKGINATYNLATAENPNITPELTFSKDPGYDVGNYTFEWISINENAASNEQRRLIHTKPNLDIPFPLGVGTYAIFYKVTEKATGVSWQKKFTIKVNGAYKGGWAVLSEINSNSRLDYFEYDHATGTYPKVYRDFTNQFADPVSGVPLQIPGKPKFLTGWTTRTSATGNGNKYFLYIGTENNVSKINVSDGFNWKEQYAFKFETAGAMALDYVDYIIPNLTGEAYAYRDGDVFYANTTYQYAFGTPINRLSNNAYFKVSKWQARSSYSQIASVLLMYDITNKRFVRNSGGATNSVSPLPYTAGTSAFDPNNVGMDLVWMGQTYAFGGRAYAVLKNGSNKYYLARMNNAAAFAVYAMDEISNCPDIAQAEQFAVDQQYGYLHYSVGGKVYQYDVDSKATKLMKDYGNLKVTLLKYNMGIYVRFPDAVNPVYATTYGKRFLPILSNLICATYDPAAPGTSGKVEMFEVPQFNGAFKTFSTYDGFGKVADVTSVEAPLGW